jgi:archaellum biogenesis protein FlaJ (TadC family)
VAWDSQMEKRRLLRYETAFSQLLFEIADAMRGGINPAKAIVEIAGTDAGAFKKQLTIAAKNIKTGRPFEEVLLTIAKPTKSMVINRYTSLIGEAAKIGGEIAIVIHRAAKDMDDLIKVKQERKRQMMIQIVTIYISFFVMLIIVYLLIDMYPKFADIDLSVIFNFNLNAADQAAAATVKKMSFVELKRRFFHLTMINSIGSGLVIGKIVEGKMKFGLIHSLVMVTISILVFVLFIL